MNKASFRCGNVHSEDKNRTLYVDGLSPTINTVVVHHRNSVHRNNFTFDALFHLAKSEDEAYRARLYHITSIFAKEQR